MLRCNDEEIQGNNALIQSRATQQQTQVLNKHFPNIMSIIREEESVLWEYLLGKLRIEKRNESQSHRRSHVSEVVV